MFNTYKIEGDRGEKLHGDTVLLKVSAGMIFQELVPLNPTSIWLFPVVFNCLMGFFIYLFTLFSFSTGTFNILITMNYLSMFFVFILSICLSIFLCFLCVNLGCSELFNLWIDFFFFLENISLIFAPSPFWDPNYINVTWLDFIP